MLKEGQRAYLENLPSERANKPVSIYPFDPMSHLLAQKYTDKIRNILPEAQVLFAGSAALKISGQRDLDLFIYASSRERSKTLKALGCEFGPPTKGDHKWKISENNYEISINVADPEDKIRKEKIKYFEILRDNPAVLNKYEELKKTMNGSTYAEYQEAKLIFMNAVLEKYGY